MALLDRFRKLRKEDEGERGKEEKKEEKKESLSVPPIERKVAGPEAEKKPVSLADAPRRRKEKKKGRALAYRILKSPHITEKASRLAKENQYIFKIFSQANKIQVKKAIEELYNVDVLKVRIIRIHSKRKRVGRLEGKKKGYKKAIVKIKQGQKIPILPT